MTTFKCSKVVIYCLLFVCCSLNAQNSISIKAEQLLQQIVQETGAPSLSVAAAHKGNLMFAVASGFADKSNKIAATPNTQYRTGSIAKVIGTTGFMKLVEQGKVKLDDHITDYLPYLPKHYQEIKLNHLFTHTSGIRHYDYGEYGTNTHYPTLESATEVFVDSPLSFKPGTDYVYSTYGINLIQGVIEQVAKKSLSDFLAEQLFLPIGLAHTELEIKGNEKTNYAIGYRSFLSSYPVQEIDVSNKYIGGGMRSTPTDLVKLISAIEAGTILDKQTRTLMFSIPYEKVAPTRMHGWRTMVHKGVNTYGHSGAVNGFESYLLHFIEDDITVAVMVNQDDYDHTSSTLYKFYDLVKTTTEQKEKVVEVAN